MIDSIIVGIVLLVYIAITTLGLWVYKDDLERIFTISLGIFSVISFLSAFAIALYVIASVLELRELVIR